MPATEQERREIALKCRPAIMVFSDAIRGMRRTFPDDAHYLAFVHHLKGVCIAEGAWLTAIAEQRAALEAGHAAAGERSDGNYEAVKAFRDGKLSLPVVEVQ